MNQEDSKVIIEKLDKIIEILTRLTSDDCGCGCEDENCDCGDNCQCESK